jgi:hypothetical protein
VLELAKLGREQPQSQVIGFVLLELELELEANVITPRYPI